MKVRWGGANRSRIGFAIYGGIGCIALLLTPVIVGSVLLGVDEETSLEPTASVGKPGSQPKPKTAKQNVDPTPLFEGIPFTADESVARQAGFSKCWKQFPGHYCGKERVRLALGPPLTAEIVCDAGGHVTIRFFDSAYRAGPLRQTVKRLKGKGWVEEAIESGEYRLTKSGSPVVVTFDPWTTMGSFPTLTAALK